MNILERYAAMDYGPAPEARNEADAWIAGRDFGKALFIAGEWRAAASGKTFDVLEPSSGKLLAKVADAGDADVDAAVAAARKALAQMERRFGLSAGESALRDRPRHAASPAPVRRGGIDRQRQADPREPRHRRAAGDPPFPASCRLGAGARPRISRPQAGRRRRPDHPVEFSAADARLEDRAGAGGRLHGRAEARRVHAADRDPVCRDLRARRRAEGRRQHFAGRPRRRCGDRQPCRRRQDRLHRLVGSRQDHPQGDRRHRQEAVAGTRRQVGLHRLRGRRSRQRGRRAGRRHLVQPGAGLLRRLAAAGAGRHRRRLHRQGQDPHEPAARRQPARQEHRYRPAGRRHPARPGARAGRRGRQAGRRMLAAGFRAAVERLFLPADAGDRRCAGQHPGAGRGIRPGAGDHDLPHHRGSDRARQQHALWPRRIGVEREPQRRALCRAAAQGRRRLGQRHQHVRCRLRLRRLPRKRLWPRRRARGHV